jgi:hypothetical protein
MQFLPKNHSGIFKTPVANAEPSVPRPGKSLLAGVESILFPSSILGQHRSTRPSIHQKNHQTHEGI